MVSYIVDAEAWLRMPVIHRQCSYDGSVGGIPTYIYIRVEGK